jgi:hypothetical protein
MIEADQERSRPSGPTRQGRQDMSEWQRSDSNEGNGYFWENSSAGISAFEDTSEGASRWYAWLGEVDDHDTAEQTGVYPTLDEAIAALNR